MFSESCTAFIAAHACEEAKEQAALALIKATLPVVTSIDWGQISQHLETAGVARERLGHELRAMAAAIGLVPNAVLTIIQADDAVPALDACLEDWLIHADELDFVDTLFLSAQDRALIHWDFYKNLHAARF